MLAATLDAINRRTAPRFDVVLPIVAAGRSGSSSNLSEGGACIELEGIPPKIGDSIEVEFAVPGSDAVRVEAEVRWTKPGMRTQFGVMFRRGHQRLVALLVAGVIGGASADASAAATTTVPTFDPNGDIVMDMEAGPEVPNSHAVKEVFSRQYDAIDACVVESKGNSDRTIEGEAHVEVLLNPKGATPLGVNTVVPGKSKKDRELVECLRAAVATADYPSYDGPPVVVEFDFELDPGFEEVPEE